MEYRINKTSSDKTFTLTKDGVAKNLPAMFKASNDGNSVTIKMDGGISESFNLDNDTLFVEDVQQSVAANAIIVLNDIIGAGFKSGGSSPSPTAVSSVNGKTGNVVLAATDVGAEPSFAKNTAFNKNFGTTAGTVAQGSHLVNADWNASSGLAAIVNKPGLQQITDINNASNKIIIGRKATKPVNASYDNGNFNAEITAAEASQGFKPGYGFHATNNFGIFLYGEDVNTLNKITSAGAITTLWDSGNLPYEKGIWPVVLLGNTTPGAITYEIKLGSYVRIGNQVTVFCYVRGTIQTKPTGALIVAGLPFNSEYAPEYIYSATTQIGFVKSSIDKYCYTGRGINYANKVSFGKEVLNEGLNSLDWTDLGDSQFQIHFQLTYIKL